ncbi:MAG TPA: hypothetical protein VJA25_05945 [Dehalococcoidia bacterium]|nr:hypothetical protein [Dehalococcoidia bacterium]
MAPLWWPDRVCATIASVYTLRETATSMDMDYPIDLPEVMNILDTSDVIIVRFATVEKRLLLDFRSSSTERPMIRLVDRVRSAEERFRDLRRLRPGLALPDRIMTFQWPKHVASLEHLGIFDRMVERFRSLGYPEMEAACKQLFAELHALEQKELLAAVKGEGYQTLWEKKGS